MEFIFLESYPFSNPTEEKSQKNFGFAKKPKKNGQKNYWKCKNLIFFYSVFGDRFLFITLVAPGSQNAMLLRKYF